MAKNADPLRTQSSFTYSSLRAGTVLLIKKLIYFPRATSSACVGR